MNLTAIMIAFGIIIKIAPMLIDLMKEAKKFFDGIPDSGVQKKEYVLTMIHTAAVGLCELTGDEADKVVQYVEDAISKLIEIFYKNMFKDDDKPVEGGNVTDGQDN